MRTIANMDFNDLSESPIELCFSKLPVFYPEKPIYRVDS